MLYLLYWCSNRQKKYLQKLKNNLKIRVHSICLYHGYVESTYEIDDDDERTAWIKKEAAILAERIVIGTNPNDDEKKEEENNMIVNNDGTTSNDNNDICCMDANNTIYWRTKCYTLASWYRWQKSVVSLGFDANIRMHPW